MAKVKNIKSITGHRCIDCVSVEVYKRILVVGGQLTVGKCLKGMKAKTKDCFESKVKKDGK